MKPEVLLVLIALLAISLADIIHGQQEEELTGPCYPSLSHCFERCGKRSVKTFHHGVFKIVI